jgi:diguanylate cyclase (GGDEF)-like protein/PAS domain S-box-containing protein
MSKSDHSGLVLVVDDQEIMRDLLSRNLQIQGHRVLTVTNGHDALRIVREHPIELVLLDVMMPEISGLEVLARLKADSETLDIPVLVLSADSDIDQIVACINLGAEDYLVKPFNPILLRARVTTSLERHRLRARERAYQATLEDRIAERTALAEQRAASLQQSEAALRRQTALFQLILKSMGDGVVVVDTLGQLVHINPAATEILGAHLASILPSSAVDPAPPPLYTSQRQPIPPEELPLAQAIRGVSVRGVEVLVAEMADAVGQWLSINARPLFEDDGAIIGGVAVVRDISGSKRTDLALRESEERYALAAQGANDGLWDWDLRQNRVYFSQRWKQMLGYADEEIGSQLSEWLDRVHPDDLERLEVRLVAHRERLITHFEHEYRIRHRDDAYRWMLCRGLAVWDDEGRAVRMAGSQTDISDRKQIEQQLLHDAFHDGLTGLPNRALFIDRLESAIARTRRNKTIRFAILFLDLDRFKIINDSLGHAIGDQFLITIARRLAECVRPGDTIARLGGDEFTMLLEDVASAEAAHEVAQRIQDVLSAALQLGEQEVFTTASIGILLSSPAYHSATEMIRDADAAMYHAKMHGKARAVMFDLSMHAQAMELLQLESDLRWAIERDELRIHYQPIIALSQGQIVGVEALIRWQHPQRGLLLPAEFLHIAEETSLIMPLSWWILRAACHQLRLWHEQIPRADSMWVSVNLAAKQLTQPNMVQQIIDILAETNLTPAHLKLEITEHTLIEYGDLTISVLNQLRALGVQLCIDDFGTGYSSLSYLQRFPVDVLKIDRTFINQLGEDNRRTEIVQTILSLARTLGMQAVAEGTETLAQAHELRRLDCDYGQGWYFSKAIDAAAIHEIMTRDLPFE